MSGLAARIVGSGAVTFYTFAAWREAYELWNQLGDPKALRLDSDRSGAKAQERFMRVMNGGQNGQVPSYSRFSISDSIDMNAFIQDIGKKIPPIEQEMVHWWVEMMRAPTARTLGLQPIENRGILAELGMTLWTGKTTFTRKVEEELTSLKGKTTLADICTWWNTQGRSLADVILNGTFSSADSRDSLLLRLKEVRTEIAIAQPLPVNNKEDLSFEECVRRIDFFVRMERRFPSLSTKDREDLLDVINQVALTRIFFPPNDLVVHRPLSERDKNMVRCLDLLNRYPQLQPKFTALWNQIGGMEDLKLELFLDVLYPWFSPEKRKEYGASVPNGILFYGPPGCGKTFIAKTLQQITGCFFTEYSPGTHGSPYIHETAREIRRVFDQARAHKPSIVFIDEVSSVCPDRAPLGKDESHREEEVSEFLKLLEGAAQEGILVVCATNFRERLDKAFLRKGRLDKQFYLPPPDRETRKAIFQQYLSKCSHLSPLINYDILADRTAGRTSADIRAIVEDAIRLAFIGDREVRMIDLENFIDPNQNV
jgi:ATP-dependent 26S proteasome regulatory subunit